MGSWPVDVVDRASQINDLLVFVLFVGVDDGIDEGLLELGILLAESLDVTKHGGTGASTPLRKGREALGDVAVPHIVQTTFRCRALELRLEQTCDAVFDALEASRNRHFATVWLRSTLTVPLGPGGIFKHWMHSTSPPQTAIILEHGGTSRLKVKIILLRDIAAQLVGHPSTSCQ